MRRRPRAARTTYFSSMTPDSAKLGRWFRTVAAPLRVAGWNLALVVAGLALAAAVGEAWLRLAAPFEMTHEAAFVPGVGRHRAAARLARAPASAQAYIFQPRPRRLPPPPCSMTSDSATAAPLRAAGWGLALIVAALALAAALGEAWLRLAMPFGHHQSAAAFVPGVGWHRAAGAEVRATDMHDFWTVSRTNSLGFLDREPPSRELAAASCHVAIVGDSVVEAWEVAIADKFTVLLEEMAAERLPHLDVTTAAYGHRATGQVHQLAFWDTWIRHVAPGLVVLVVVGNDLYDNNVYPSRFTAAEPLADGGFALVAPAPSFRPPATTWRRIQLEMVSRSYLVRRLKPAWALMPPPPERWADPGPTAFALDQWQIRAGESGAGLVMLNTSRVFADEVEGMARARSIPVVGQRTYMARAGGLRGDEVFVHDGHWNRQGHIWAAEALLEWLAANQAACGERPAVSRPALRDN